ncbi:hypothetical protein BHM03_00031409 [Ensete ventricosum]|nr:hypothetical protein BHM03_00031409 [Ensete ventricosum]
MWLGSRKQKALVAENVLATIGEGEEEEPFIGGADCLTRGGRIHCRRGRWEVRTRRPERKGERPGFLLSGLTTERRQRLTSPGKEIGWTTAREGEGGLAMGLGEEEKATTMGPMGEEEADGEEGSSCSVKESILDQCNEKNLQWVEQKLSLDNESEYRGVSLGDQNQEVLIDAIYWMDAD